MRHGEPVSRHIATARRCTISREALQTLFVFSRRSLRLGTMCKTCGLLGPNSILSLSKVVSADFIHQQFDSKRLDV